MNFKILFPVMLGLSVSLLTNCKPGTKNEIKLTDSQDTTKKTTDTTSVNSKTDSTSVNNNENTDPTMASYLDAVHKEFDGLASPFEGKYMGFDMGDYPHIIFKDKNGKEYDFGDGENSFGSFKEEEIVNEKSKYNGKMFKVTWEWKTSTFNCCDGEMDLKTAKRPCIVNLELMK